MAGWNSKSHCCEKSYPLSLPLSGQNLDEIHSGRLKLPVFHLNFLNPHVIPRPFGQNYHFQGQIATCVVKTPQSPFKVFQNHSEPPGSKEKNHPWIRKNHTTQQLSHETYHQKLVGG